MKNVLFVSVAFPPKNDPECLQTAKYFKYLALQNELALIVATSSLPTLFMPYDSNLDKYNEGFIQKIEIPIIESKLTNFFLRKLLPNGIDYPDSKFTFHWQIKRVVHALKGKPNVIYSRSNPLSSSILAFKLADYYNVPWVMHLSDPWADSPVKDYSKHQRAYHEKWESKCFAKANYVCLTSSHAVEFYKKKYPQLIHKFQYFPNVFDLVDLSSQEIDFSNKLKIVYTGGLSGDRSAKVFLKACKEYISENPSHSDLFEVIFAGPIDRKNREVFDNSALKNIKHIGELSYGKALNLIKDSHILLNIDLPIQDQGMAMFFASKILDYFLAKRKILSLTSRGSASEKILRQLNTVILELDDVSGIKAFLEKAISAYQRGDKYFFTLEPVMSEFSAEINANRLAGLLKSF